MLRRSVFGSLLGFCALTLAAALPSQADEMTVAAGAGYRRPLAEIAAAYEKASGHKILQVYGHMGQVLAQARESEQIALVCGDGVVLRAAKGVAFGKMVRLGPGRLVIAWRKGLALTAPEDIAGPDFKRIAIPDQVNAIYGKAGRQFLDRSELAAQIDARLVAVATVPQVTSYVASGEVDAGFLNATDAIGAAANIGGFIEVSPSLYDPVDISCGAVERPNPSPLLQGFAAFLATDQARGILKRHGL